LATRPHSSKVTEFGVIIGGGKPVNPMEERIESFLADPLALEGEDENAVRDGVRAALADYEQIFRAQEVNKRMKDKAAHACHALCRSRVVEEIKRRKGTATADHLKLVLNVIEGSRFPPKDG
jgi:hypothetical protein